MNYAKLSKLQLDLLKSIEPSQMSIQEQIRYGKSLLIIHKKSREIIRKISIEEEEGHKIHWEIIKKITDDSLNGLISSLEISMFDLENFGIKEMIASLDLISAVKASFFEEDRLDKQFGEDNLEVLDMSRNLRALIRLDEMSN